MGVSNQIAIKAGVDVLQVRGNLMHALYRSWSDPQNITVTAHGGTVRLTGTASTPRDRELAAMTAWSTPGATAVVNDITIA
jgi:osmotically-inducible protein OsmY